MTQQDMMHSSLYYCDYRRGGAYSPGGSVGTNVQGRPLPNGPTVVLIQSVVIETEGGHATATRPKHEQLPPVRLLEPLRPFPEPADHAVVRVEVRIHVPGGGGKRRFTHSNACITHTRCVRRRIHRREGEEEEEEKEAECCTFFSSLGTTAVVPIIPVRRR